jgi:arginase
MSLQVLIKAPFQQGQRKSGVESGCDALEKLIISNFNIDIIDTMCPLIRSTHGEEDWKHDYYRLYLKMLSFEKPYVLLGGDHSIGMSSVASSIHKTSDVNNLYVIWIDAHADSNTMEASITKNIHGQPLAGILGYEEPWFPIKATLPFTNLLYFGIRDLDDFEKEKIAKHNIFNTRNLTTMIDKILSILKSNIDAVFHVSFDVDALDSSIMRATGCVVDDGLYPSDVISIINLVKNRLIAFDLVEFNPNLNGLGESDLTTSYNSIAQIILGISK